MTNPYAPPKDGPFVPPPAAAAEEGVVTCTVVLNERELASGLVLTAKPARWSIAFIGGVMGFVVSGLAHPGLRFVVGAVCAALGWFFAPKLFVGNAKRALANKPEAERTFYWRFSPDGFEITTPASYSRANWSIIHRFLEGPTAFVLYASEAVVHVIPKSALRGDDVNALRALLTSRIIARKKPSLASRFAWVGVLWVVLILMFLAMWQFLQPGH
jgi:hypothetical protein